MHTDVLRLSNETKRVLLDADVMLIDNPVSKRFTVTVPDSVFDDLETLADAQGRPTANLAAFLIELGIAQAKERGEFPERKKNSSSNKDKADG